MQIIVHVPDDFVDPVKEKLSSGPTGVLETVALDAIIGYLEVLAESDNSIEALDIHLPARPHFRQLEGRPATRDRIKLKFPPRCRLNLIFLN